MRYGIENVDLLTESADINTKVLLTERQQLIVEKIQSDIQSLCEADDETIDSFKEELFGSGGDDVSNDHIKDLLKKLSPSDVEQFVQLGVKKLTTMAELVLSKIKPEVLKTYLNVMPELKNNISRIKNLVLSKVNPDVYKSYTKAGVDGANINDIIQLSTSKISPDTFKGYIKNGITKISDMISLRSRRIMPSAYKSYASKTKLTKISDITSLMDAKVKSDMFKQYQDRGVTRIADICNLKLNGVTPSVYSKFIKDGINNQDEMIRLHGESKLPDNINDLPPETDVQTEDAPADVSGGKYIYRINDKGDKAQLEVLDPTTKKYVTNQTFTVGKNILNVMEPVEGGEFYKFKAGNDALVNKIENEVIGKVATANKTVFYVKNKDILRNGIAIKTLEVSNKVNGPFKTINQDVAKKLAAAINDKANEVSAKGDPKVVTTVTSMSDKFKNFIGGLIGNVLTEDDDNNQTSNGPIQGRTLEIYYNDDSITLEDPINNSSLEFEPNAFTSLKGWLVHDGATFTDLGNDQASIELKDDEPLTHRWQAVCDELCNIDSLITSEPVAQAMRNANDMVFEDGASSINQDDALKEKVINEINSNIEALINGSMDLSTFTSQMRSVLDDVDTSANQNDTQNNDDNFNIDDNFDNYQIDKQTESVVNNNMGLALLRETAMVGFSLD